MTPELLGRAVAELRGDLDLDDLALAVGQSAHLLGVLSLAGERRGAPPPHVELGSPPSAAVAWRLQRLTARKWRNKGRRCQRW
jgi:hypothetical protein